MRKLYRMSQLDAEHRIMCYEICKKYMCDTCPLDGCCVNNCDPVKIEEAYNELLGNKLKEVTELEFASLFKGD